MAPQITRFSDLTHVAEVFGDNEEFLYTEFHLVTEDDVVYYGKLEIDKLKISLEQFTAALQRVPDEELFPELPSDVMFTLAPEDLSSDSLYLKRSRLKDYNDYKEQDAVDLLSLMLLDEARALELVSKHPHPGIIKYHGCRVRRGHITGLLLDKYPYDLGQYLKDSMGKIDKEAFVAALDSAVQHLHSLGLAHNDINPGNILINAERMPVLVDFGSCCEIGQKLGASRGTAGWMEGDMDDYTTSETRHDTFAVERIRAWLDTST
jgi:serine/threonine protein kinase